MRCAANYTKIRIDVFKTCVHCCDDLGANEVLSTFPVGERLAFDSVKGRLWVICPYRRFNATNGSTLTARLAGAAAATAATTHSVIATHAIVGPSVGVT